MNYSNENSMLSHYLKKLNSTPLLKKAEEVALVEKIEVSQTKIVEACVKYEFFISEFLSLLNSNSMEHDDVVGLTRLLDQNSTTKDILSMKADLISFEKALKINATYSTLKEMASNLKFTGTVVNQLVTKINKKYTKIQECDDALRRLLKYFDCKNMCDLEQLIKLIKTDATVKDYTAKKFYTTPGKIMGRVHDFEQYKLQLKSLSNLGLSLDDLNEVKKIYKLIVKFEFEMKQHKNVLIERNLRLVVSRAKVHLNKGLEFEDLIQEGNIGLMKAINKYDRSRGTKISTYATWWIDQTIKRSISNKSRTVRIPTHIEFLQTTLLKVTKVLADELGRSPTLAEISERSGVSEQELRNLQQRALHSIGLQDEMSEGVRLEDVLSSDPEHDPFNITSKTMLREKVRSIIGSLSPRAEKIIRLRFGIGEPHEEKTLDQIAGEIGLTKMGVKQAQTRALKELKKNGDFDE